VARLEINADLLPKQSSRIVISKVRRRKPKKLTPDEDLLIVLIHYRKFIIIIYNIMKISISIVRYLL